MPSILNNIWLIVAIIVPLAIGLIGVIWKSIYQFHWFNFWYDFPLIGKMRGLTDASPDSKDKSWTRAEKTLCSDYARFVELGNVEAFNNRAEYIRKAKDLGVKPMPSWVNVFLWVLIIAEGFGFAYSLGTWAAMEGSENIHTLLMIALALVIAVPSALLSHEAGIRYHRWSNYNRYYKEWKSVRKEDEPFKSVTIDLNKYDQTEDDNQPDYTQYANRRHEKKQLLPLWGAIAWAAIVVVLSTTARISHLETVMSQESVGIENSQTIQGGNPFAAVPPELANAQVNADKKATAEIKTSTFIEGSAAFLMLSFLYLATQGVGAALSAKYAFLGTQSETAYKGNFGFETYDDFIRYYEPLVQIAQSRLQTLQERLGSQDDINREMKLHKTFDDYQQERQERKRTNARREQNTPSKEDTPRGHSQTEEHLVKIAGMGDDRDAKIKYISQLPQELQITVKAELKLRKEQNEATKLASLSQEYDGIL